MSLNPLMWQVAAKHGRREDDLLKVSLDVLDPVEDYLGVFSFTGDRRRIRRKVGSFKGMVYRSCRIQVNTSQLRFKCLSESEELPSVRLRERCVPKLSHLRDFDLPCQLCT